MDEALTTRVLPAHGGQLSAIAAAFSVPIDRLLDFSASIYPDGPSARVIEALSSALRSPQQLRQYPDLESLALRTNLETYAAVSAGNIVVANGIVPLMSASLRAMEVRRCLLPVPAFGEYRRILERESIEFHTYPLDPNADFRPDLELVIAYCVERNCDSVILNNPHNPSGVTFAATRATRSSAPSDRESRRMTVRPAGKSLDSSATPASCRTPIAYPPPRPRLLGTSRSQFGCAGPRHHRMMIRKATAPRSD